MLSEKIFRLNFQQQRRQIRNTKKTYKKKKRYSRYSSPAPVSPCTPRRSSSARTLQHKANFDRFEKLSSSVSSTTHRKLSPFSSPASRLSNFRPELFSRGWCRRYFNPWLKKGGGRLLGNTLPIFERAFGSKKAFPREKMRKKKRMKLRGREDKDGRRDAKESQQCSSNVSGHGQFRGGKFSLPLRRFLSVSSQEEVLPGRSIPGVRGVCSS